MDSSAALSRPGFSSDPIAHDSCPMTRAALPLREVLRDAAELDRRPSRPAHSLGANYPRAVRRDCDTLHNSTHLYVYTLDVFDPIFWPAMGKASILFVDRLTSSSRFAARRREEGIYQ